MAPTHHRFSSAQLGEGECSSQRSPTERKPHWLKVPIPGDGAFSEVDRILAQSHLSTVCRAARCPNQGECWGAKTATFLVMGDVCTRACRFCHVATGHPNALDAEEPDRVAHAVASLGLKYAVITSVDRDDLADGGASHLADVIQAIHTCSPSTLVEVLIPDFGGRSGCLDRVLAASPTVVGHNIETVRRLTPSVRDRRASYDQSLAVLAHLAASKSVRVKSSIMLGVGETPSEILETMDDLRGVGTEILTLGQYLQPSPYHLKVQRFVPPEAFDELKAEALKRGFSFVAAGPLVRSSYRAQQAVQQPTENKNITQPTQVEGTP